MFLEVLKNNVETIDCTWILCYYYKTLNKNKEFLILGIINLILLTGVIVLVHTFISQNIIYISITTVIVEFIWYLSLDCYLNTSYTNLYVKNIIYILLSSVSFYLIALYENLFIGFILYALMILILTLIFYKKDIMSIYIKFKERKNNSVIK